MTTHPSRTRKTPGRAALLVAVLALLVAADDPPKDGGKPDLSALIELHNTARAEAKLGPLTPSAKLEAAAKVQAKDQADHNKMTHDGSDGSKPAERIERQGYRYKTAGENVAMGQRTSKQVFQAWMDSPPHKKNILGDFTELGVACHVAQDGVPFWCVTFGRPWPEVDANAAAPGMIEALNAARAEARLAPLQRHATLEAAAARHAREMAEAAKFLDKDPDGQSPTARAQKSGYAASALAEADALGRAAPKDAVRGWLDSEASKKVVLGDYQDVGVGVAADAKGVPYWTVLFGKPRPNGRGH